MPNSYYNNDNAPQNATKANAQNEDADRDALEAAFDLLPSPTDIARGELNYQGTDTGAVNAYAVAITRITALSNGQRVTFVPAATNTAASTLNVSALGASAIIGLDGLPIAAGEIVASRPATVIRQGTNWILQNSALNSKASAAAAAASATEAAASAVTAEAASDAAAATANVTEWVSGASYSNGLAVYSPMDFQTYRRIIPGAGATDPSLDSVNWTIISGGLRLPVSRRTSNTVLSASDKGNLIEVTSGTFTQTIGTISLLGASWYCWYKNAGTGNVTITTDGVTYIMYPGEMRLLFINAAADGLDSIVINTFQALFLTSGTFYRPPGYSGFNVFCQGGGGSGGAGWARTLADASVGGGSGGSGGAGMWAFVDFDRMGASQSAGVGAGAVGGVGVRPEGAGGDGGFGGTTIFGDILRAQGGKQGLKGSYSGESAGGQYANYFSGFTSAHSEYVISGSGGGAGSGFTGTGGKAVLTGGGGGGGGGGFWVGGPAIGFGGSGGSRGFNANPAGGGSNGQNGTSGTYPGAAGGGGAGAINADGGDGGHGYLGGGGGGGGACVGGAGYTSGAGGNGGDGYILVIGVV